MLCDKCGKKLTGRQKRWCSFKCSKLGLKSEWKKRNRDKQNAYQREYRRAKNGGNRPHKQGWKLREKLCLRCGSNEDLQLAHIKPIGLGGTHKNVVTFCRPCHFLFDELLREYWQEYAPKSL